jgi:hypothetical protein
VQLLLLLQQRLDLWPLLRHLGRQLAACHQAPAETASGSRRQQLLLLACAEAW